jgi:altronate hydrolase
MDTEVSRPNYSPFIRLDPADNVIVARMPVAANTAVPVEGRGAAIVTLHDVPAGHKIAARFITKGEAVRKYDTVIGYASEDLPPGTWMHSHNILFDEVEKDYAFSCSYKPTDYVPEAERAAFRGILREDGRVATRNYVGVFTLGNAGATAARKIAAHFTPDRLEAFPMVDGVAPFAHEGGHGMERSGEAMALLRRTIGGTIRNPNNAAALIIASGEESNDLEGFLREQGLEPGPALRTLVLAESGGLRRGVEAGIALVKEMLPTANAVTRQPLPVSHLTVGMQCGGSDGFSGLSANPALGAAMDILIRQGGTAILSETPEIFGVEQTLTARARTPEVGQKLVDRMNWWLSHTEGRDCQINGRVSPGNNAGGLANILEKSLGGAKKGGSTGLMEVYEYAEPVTQKGFVFMDTPGYDPVSATGQIAGGANMIIFTTGRGSCFGSLPAPTIKLASNTTMYERMKSDMDVNTGLVIDGEATVQEMGRLIFDQLLRHASGERTKSEISGMGANEFIPWPIGVTA